MMYFTDPIMGETQSQLVHRVFPVLTTVVKVMLLDTPTHMVVQDNLNVQDVLRRAARHERVEIRLAKEEAIRQARKGNTGPVKGASGGSGAKPITDPKGKKGMKQAAAAKRR